MNYKQLSAVFKWIPRPVRILVIQCVLLVFLAAHLCVNASEGRLEYDGPFQPVIKWMCEPEEPTG